MPAGRLHHVGSVPPRAIAQLAARHPGTVPSDLDQLARVFIFADFPHFIRNYSAVVDVIKSQPRHQDRAAFGNQLLRRDASCLTGMAAAPERAAFGGELRGGATLAAAGRESGSRGGDVADGVLGFLKGKSSGRSG